MSERTTPTVRRLEFLDAIRAFAAVLVVFAHLLELVPAGKAVIERFPFGFGSVVSFFLVSGFVIPFSLERANHLGRFWIGRFFRLIPLWWVCLAVVGVTYAVAPDRFSFRVAAAEGGFPLWAQNAALVQWWTGRPSLIGLGWSLSFEMGFYVLASVIFLTPWRKSPIPILWLFTLYNAFVARAWRPTATIGLNDTELLLGTFFAGTVAFRWMTGDDRRPAARWALIGWFALVGWILVRTIAFGPAANAYGFLFGHALFFGFFAFRERIFGPAIAYLGKISYSIYLVHGTIFCITAGIAVPARIVIVLLGTIVVSPLTYRFVEEPAIALGRRFVRRPASASP